jgi:hypothetical protein
MHFACRTQFANQMLQEVPAPPFRMIVDTCYHNAPLLRKQREPVACQGGAALQNHFLVAVLEVLY